MIDAHAGADEHEDADRQEQRARGPGRQPQGAGDNGQDAERDAVVIGIALKQAECARDISADMLETERAANGRRHAERQENGDEQVVAGSGGSVDHAYLTLESIGISVRPMLHCN
ncbi:hypothetical protein D3C87_1895610 [compost metagenome]